MNARVVLLPAVLLGLALPTHAQERVSLRVSPAMAFAPASLFVRATVDANAENRSLEIIAESADFYRSSEVSLDGDHAPRVTQLLFKSVPRGNYELRAVLRGVAGREIASTETKVDVVGEKDF
jgi:hypothetical protein